MLHYQNITETKTVSRGRTLY